MPLPPPLPLPPLGFGAPHFLQVTFLANWWSPHFLHFQSPGFISFSSFGLYVSEAAAASKLPSGSGVGVLHFRHCLFFANCRSLQPGQNQSPGFISWPPCPAAMPASMAALLPSGSGFGSEHLRQTAFLAKLISWHEGHSQSPAFLPPLTKPPFVAPAA